MHLIISLKEFCKETVVSSFDSVVFGPFLLSVVLVVKENSGKTTRNSFQGLLLLTITLFLVGR